MGKAQMQVDNASLAPSPSPLVVAFECGTSTSEEALTFGASRTVCEKKLEQSQVTANSQKKRFCLRNANLHVDKASIAPSPSPLVAAIQCGKSTASDETIAFESSSTGTTKKRFVLRNAKLLVQSPRA